MWFSTVARAAVYDLVSTSVDLQHYFLWGPTGRGNGTGSSSISNCNCILLP